VPDPPAGLSPDLFAAISYYTYGGSQNRGAAPPCDQQSPLGGLIGQPGWYPRLQPLP
jgi:hypothetical protein